MAPGLPTVPQEKEDSVKVPQNYYVKLVLVRTLFLAFPTQFWGFRPSVWFGGQLDCQAFETLPLRGVLQDTVSGHGLVGREGRMVGTDHSFGSS